MDRKISSAGEFTDVNPNANPKYGRPWSKKEMELMLSFRNTVVVKNGQVIRGIRSWWEVARLMNEVSMLRFYSMNSCRCAAKNGSGNRRVDEHEPSDQSVDEASELDPETQAMVNSMQAAVQEQNSLRIMTEDEMFEFLIDQTKVDHSHKYV